MIKKLLVTFLAIYSIAINAQINITSSDMPSAGNSYIVAGYDSVLDYGTAGANQTWDFSSWGNDYVDTAFFENPANLIGASYFPSATIGSGDTASASFMKNSSTAFELLGFYANFNGGFDPVVFNPAQTFLSLPSTYQTTFSGTSSYDIIFPSGQLGDSLKVINIQNYTSIIDGWGSLSTPTYSNLSTLRQYFTVINTDSLFSLTAGDSVWASVNVTTDTSYNYRWWSNAHTYPVAEISVYAAIDNVFFGSYLTSTLVGVNELAKNTNSVSVFPSPASDKVTFKGINSDAYLIVFDVAGKLVDKSLVRKNTTINVANYNNGIYFYNVAPLNGSSVSKGKFVVEK